jgi:hypothetical protein
MEKIPFFYLYPIPDGVPGLNGFVIHRKTRDAMHKIKNRRIINPQGRNICCNFLYVGKFEYFCGGNLKNMDYAGNRI